MRPDVFAFLEQLRAATTPDAAVKITEGEIADLRGRLTLGSLKLYLSLRRTAVRDHLGTDHPAFDLLKLSDSDYAELRDQYQADVSDRQTHPIRIKDTAAAVGRATALLDSDSPTAVLLGLCLLTGRRPIELAANPNTELLPVYTAAGAGGRIRDRWALAFRGQAKTKGRPGTTDGVTYVIPVLADSGIVLAAWTRLRADLAPQWVGLATAEFNAKTAKRLNELCDKTFVDLWPDDRARELTVRALRALYAEICCRVFNATGTAQELMKPSEYLARILGHRENDTATAQSYMRFVLDKLPAPPTPRPLPDFDAHPNLEPKYYASVDALR